MAVAVSPDGRWLAAGRSTQNNEPQFIDLWDLVFNKPVDLAKSRPIGPQIGHGVGVAFTTDSQTLLVVSRKFEPPGGDVQFGSPIGMPGEPPEQSRVVAWEVATGKERIGFDATAPGGFAFGFSMSGPMQRSFTVSPDGKALIVGQRDGIVRLWDWKTGKERNSFMAHPGVDGEPFKTAGIVALSLSPDGRTLVTAGRYGSPHRWVLETGQRIDSADDKFNILQSIVTSPDGKFFATGDTAGQFRIWNLATGAEHIPLSGHSGFVEKIQLSTDGRSVLTAASDDSVRSTFAVSCRQAAAERCQSTVCRSDW
jgi:WD40 repeat protein